MYESEIKFLETIKEIEDKSKPLEFTRLEVLILLRDYKKSIQKEEIVVANNKWANFPDVTRVDINDKTGKEFESWDKRNQVKIMLQDNKRTLIVFIEDREKGT